jgi:tetraacyldisaccharide 4'-kinase
MRPPGFWSAAKPTFFARALQPIGAAYGATTERRMRNGGERAGAPVVCVGNFVAGGAGKTPAAIALARLLIAERRRVAFLSRGYGPPARAEPVLVDAEVHRASVVGDEPLLLAKIAPCWVSADRVRSARLAVEAGANALVLDDGLQNPSLAKDLAFAVVDGETGFGNGLCVPAGPLRAPVAAQAAHVRALIVIGGDDAAAARIGSQAPGKPIIRANLEPDALAAASLIGREVVAFAGIARPEKFYATLRRIGAQVVATRDFPDHHAFKPREIEALIAEAGRRGALLATTEKDYVRLKPAHAKAVVTLPVTLRFETPKAVESMLRGLGGRPKPR